MNAEMPPLPLTTQGYLFRHECKESMRESGGTDSACSEQAAVTTPMTHWSSSVSFLTALADLQIGIQFVAGGGFQQRASVTARHHVLDEATVCVVSAKRSVVPSSSSLPPRKCEPDGLRM